MNNGNTISMIRHVATRRFFAVLVLFVLLFAYFSVTQSKFLTSGNIDALLTGSSILWMVSIGLTFVMLTGGFDLSLGSLMAMSGIAMATFMNGWGLPLGIGILLTVLFGLLVGGLVNGVLIGRVGLPFLVVTLGTLTLYGGVVNLWSKGATEAIISKDLTAIAFNHALGIPVPAWIMVGVFLIALYVQRSTYFGRDVYAVGGSPDAARLSGIRVTRVLIAVYAIAGMLAAVAGVMQVARIGAASPQVGGEIIFSAAAAVLLGGTSFSGGVGGVGGTIIGVLLLATLENGLSVSGVQSYWQQIITGVILVAVVTLDRFQQVGFKPAFRRLRRPPQATAPPPAVASSGS
ncbi:MAG TPA: ABC transporter permease [Solirubrobacterales bacterium]|jgi:ribose/xylose/arabinose/galactoside ABC-type transport system permease subunit